MLALQLRLALAVSLGALGAACGSQTAEAPAPTAAQVETVPVGTVPAAPPASNAAPVVATDAGPAEAPADTVEAPASATDPETEAAFRQILQDARAQDVAARPYGEIVQWVGEQLVGRPYVAGLLDAPPEETLVVDLTRFDCVLYVENVLAIARAVALNQDTFEDYARGVEALRYRDGAMDGYCSRLHYFSDWIADNERRGAVQNVTAAVGGERFDKTVSFMSENREAYPKLVSDETFACVVAAEGELADLELFYVPQDRIADAYGLLQPGDVIATATSIGGLDVTHTGFVHKTEAGTGFMHASLSSDRVKVSDDLGDYVQGIPNQVGVVVARPVDPRAGG
jgi:cell wall-associated NlpC family hydrolase